MICDRPDRSPKGYIVYGPPSASRRHCMDHRKQAQITFNLFHFNRHRVPYIQDGEKGGMGSRVV